MLLVDSAKCLQSLERLFETALPGSAGNASSRDPIHASLESGQRCVHLLDWWALAEQFHLHFSAVVNADSCRVRERMRESHEAGLH